MRISLILSILSLLIIQTAFGDEHSFKQIDTCYHWQEQWQLDAKIKYAKENNGKLLFHGGEIIYCWRTPLGAQSKWEDHGDSLIRIKFKPGVKITHFPRQYGIENTLLHGEVIYSNNNIWQEYTITPDAVESWSAYHPNMIKELQADLNYHMAGKVVEDDIFYPIRKYRLGWIKRKIPKMIKEHKSRRSTDLLFGENLDRHFSTSIEFAWHEYLDTSYDTIFLDY
jgi:hypothetical protein